MQKRSSTWLPLSKVRVAFYSCSNRIFTSKKGRAPMEMKAKRNPCTKLLSNFTKITPIFNLEFVVFPPLYSY